MSGTGPTWVLRGAPIPMLAAHGDAVKHDLQGNGSRHPDIAPGRDLPGQVIMSISGSAAARSLLKLAAIDEALGDLFRKKPVTVRPTDKPGVSVCPIQG